MTYKLTKDLNGQILSVIKDNSNWIPFDPANTDYQVYLEWLSEGNTPQPAEQP